MCTGTGRKNWWKGSNAKERCKCEDGFIEIYNYPRGDKATITYTSDGHTETIEAGETAYALDYEVEDMQNYVLNGGSEEYLTYSRDVMSVLTDVRKQWGMIYPFE